MKRALDLFCGVGGASMGLHRAGYDVTGVDLRPQRHYPFEFIQSDALTFPLEGYDLIWASPPCQAFSQLRHMHANRHPDLIAYVRARLQRMGGPYIIENVVNAPLCSPVMLCGAQFGLKTYRHRLFESNYLLLVPPHIPHKDKSPRASNSKLSPKGFIGVYGNPSPIAYARAAMGIEWATGAELSQAIPPAYSEFLARQIIV